MDIIEFYNQAKQDIIQKGHRKEIEIVENRTLNDITSGQFFWEYTYVVFNAGMKNQVAEKMYQRFISEGIDTVKHLGKKKAIEYAVKHYKRWFKELKKLESTIDKLIFLKSLPWIGNVTKYHLARNLGIDVAKPDRHMVRLANQFGYDSDVMCMCNDISKQVGDRIGTVDVVLWRYCNLNQDYMSKLGIKANEGK